MNSRVTKERHTERLVLTPLAVADAPEMLGVLADPELYTFTGGSPPTLDELAERYGAQVVGPSTGDQIWHNWILRLAESRMAIGLVQVTVVGHVADLSWEVSAFETSGVMQA